MRVRVRVRRDGAERRGVDVPDRLNECVYIVLLPSSTALFKSCSSLFVRFPPSRPAVKKEKKRRCAKENKDGIQFGDGMGWAFQGDEWG